jgi:hypothetical protein
MELEEYSEEELKAELKRRDLLKQVPEQCPADKIDWTKCIETAKSNLENIIEDPGADDDEDDRYYAYEALMEAVYGEAFFTWKNAVK